MTTTPTSSPSGASRWRWPLGGTAVVLGLASVIEGGQVLFGGPEVRAQAGDTVPFVLAFNFGAGFAYVLAGAATLLRRQQAIWLARGLAAATLIVFLALGVHVMVGGAFETRTIIAMSVRSLFWVAQALLVPRVLGREPRTTGAAREEDEAPASAPRSG